MQYAGFWQRLAAGVLDWTACLILPYVVVTMSGSLLFDAFGGEGALALSILLLLVAPPALAVAYFTYSWSRGQTLGMKATGIRVAHERDGKPPSVGRSFLRAALAALAVAAVVVVSFFGFGDPPEEGYSPGELALYAVALGVVTLGVLSHFWIPFDARKQSWHDKLFRLVVLRAD